MDTHDRTSRLENEIDKRLLQLQKRGELSREHNKRIKPVGSLRPRMYGLPKTHKQNVPLRPILSMVGSAQHQLAKWLGELLQPALESVSRIVIKDSFTLSDAIRETCPTGLENVMCYFDIDSLFTNAPLTETIDICAHLLYHMELEHLPISESVFIELMNMATRDVEFSFNNIMFVQIDGVAMGSPLGPMLGHVPTPSFIQRWTRLSAFL